MVLENFIVDAPIVWDRVGKKIFENPHVKQGRKMRVQITNAGMVEDLSGYTLALGWKHTVSGVDGLDVFEDSSEANVGIFEMAYTENLMTNLGNLKASLVLTSVEDMVVAESNDFYVKVDDSPFGADAEQGVGSYTRLAQILLNEEIRQEAYLKNEALVGSIDDKFDAFIQTNIVQEEVAEVFNNLEETYAQDLLSVKNGLEQTAKNQLLASSFDWATREDGNKRRPYTPIISFVNDDGIRTGITRLRGIFESRGVNFGEAVVLNWIGKDFGDHRDCMTVEELHDMQNAGHEIMSHGRTHLGLNGIAYDQAEVELRDNLIGLRNMGFYVESHVYPGGNNDSVARSLCKKYFRSALKVGGGVISTYPLEQFSLQREAMGSFTAPGHDSYEYYKSKVDEAVSNNGLLIFMLHAWETPESQFLIMEQVLDYIQSINVPIMNVRDALKIKGNVAHYGDNTPDTSRGEVIGANYLKNNGNVIFNDRDVIPFDTKPSEYLPTQRNKRAIIVTSYGGTGGSPAPSQIKVGTLITYLASYDEYKLKDYDYAWQEWHAYRNSTVYRRYAINGEWDSWNKITNTVKSINQNVSVGIIPAGRSKNIDLNMQSLGGFTLQPLIVNPLMNADNTASQLPNGLLVTIKQKTSSLATLTIFNALSSDVDAGTVQFRITTMPTI